jgi:hypothetical protein
LAQQAAQKPCPSASATDWSFSNPDSWRQIGLAKCSSGNSQNGASFRGTGASPAFSRYIGIRKIAGETPAPHQTIVYQYVARTFRILIGTAS